jgi:hypothetical protein
MWALYCSIYSSVTEQLVDGAGDEQVRRAFLVAQRESRIVQDLKARNGHVATYAGMCNLAVEHALTGKPPHCAGDG